MHKDLANYFESCIEYDMDISTRLYPVGSKDSYAVVVSDPFKALALLTKGMAEHCLWVGEENYKNSKLSAEPDTTSALEEVNMMLKDLHLLTYDTMGKNYVIY